MEMETTVINEFKEANLKNFALPLITIYKQPKDFPDYYVGRLYDLDEPTSFAVMEKDMEILRKKIPAGMVRLERNAEDDPVIVEVWV